MLRTALENRQRENRDSGMLKVVCPECSYTVRTIQQWIDTGLPTCVCDTEMELAKLNK
jgi:hypothetical protein